MRLKISTLLILLVGIVMTSSAQSWTCSEITDNIKTFNDVKTGNKKWAEKLKSFFPLNKDNEIELVYVLKCSDSISRPELIALAEGWVKTVFTNATEQIQASNADKLICVGELGQVAFDQKFIGATRIMAPLEIMILYKDDRIRLSLLTRNFRMAYANIGQIESGNINIGSCFPFNKDSKHKEAYSIAYINTLSKLLNLSHGCLQYFNKHVTDTSEELPEW